MIYLKGLGKKPGIMPSFSGFTYGPEIQSLLNTLLEKESALEEMKLTVSTQSDGYKNAQVVLEQLRTNILELIGNMRKNLLIFQSSASKESDRYNKLIAQLPGQERQLFSISRQQQIKNELYKLLLSKREEAAIQSAVALSDLVILQPPSSSSTPVNINKSQTYLIGFFGGAGVVILILFLFQMLNNTLVSRGQLETLTKIPVLGIISESKNQEHLVMLNNSRSAIAEQFRILRTNIGYYKKNETDSFVVVVTSCIPGEGKSFNAANLALTFAMTGASTLLIESDLRKPNISKHFNINRQKGLSTYLAGKSSWQNLIVDTEYENMQLLSCGPIPPNPVELIMNGKYKAFIEEARKEFSYIVIDCPPVGVVTDAELIASLADIMIFVTRFNKTPKVLVEKLINPYNTEKKITQTGLIFNGVKPKRLGYYGYKYGYGYGYGYCYGYGYYTSEKKV
jgi:capsular exopolysaccharide synthesis family protein